ncbi:MAG: helix-turn-helix domain-containing protein [Firmicutes bacterium]|nr:helix-turn-helix domain-containing protein [Bacillota bacterium]
MPHANATLTERGRLKLAQCVVDDGWPLRRAAERFQVSPTTAKRWADRYRQAGAAGMVDRSSRPHRSPNRTRPPVERKILHLRRAKRLGPAAIAGRLGMHASTVHKVLVRHGVPKLACIDLATGQPIRKEEPRRYEHPTLVTWCTWTSRSSAASPTAAAGEPSAGPPGVATAAPAHRQPAATATSTAPSTTTPAWPTARSSPTSKDRPRSRSGSAPRRSSPATASPYAAYSPIMDLATDPASGAACSPRPASCTSEPARTGPA